MSKLPFSFLYGCGFFLFFFWREGTGEKRAITSCEDKYWEIFIFFQLLIPLVSTKTICSVDILYSMGYGTAFFFFFFNLYTSTSDFQNWTKLSSCYLVYWGKRGRLHSSKVSFMMQERELIAKHRQRVYFLSEKKRFFIIYQNISLK